MFFLAAKELQELGHARWLPIFKQLVFLLHQVLRILNALDLDLAQFDLSEFVLLTLTLFNDKPQILLANFAITVFFVDSILILDLAQFSIQIIDHALFVILDLQQVLVNYVHRVWSHLLLLFFVSFGKLFDDLFIPIFELTRVFDFGIQIRYDFLLHVIRHRQIALIADCRAVIHDYVHKRRHASSEARPHVLGLSLRLR